MAARDPDTGQFTSETDDVIDLDWFNSYDWHVQHNMKNDVLGGDDGSWYEDFIQEPALNGELKRSQVYLLTGLTVWSFSMNIANQAAREKPEELNVAYEISLNPKATFASKRNNAIVVDGLEASGGDANTTIDVRRPTSPSVNNGVLFAARVDSASAYENGTSGNGGGLHTTAFAEPVFMDFRRRYGSPIPMGPDDYVHYHLLVQEDGVTQNYSMRAPHTFHGTVYGEEPDPYPEVVDVL